MKVSMQAIKLIKSTFYKEQATKDALCSFIQSVDQLSMGEQCQKFEMVFSWWQGRQYTTLFNSGSSANLALIQALLNMGRIAPQSKVAFSGITWATNVMPIMQLGLVPIPIDVELSSLNVSSRLLKKAYKKEPFSVFFITNLLGLADDIGEIQSFCEENNILLLEDNCESLGSVVQGKKLGNFSLASTFSFFVGHHMSSIEGGAVCTDDQELDMQLKMVRSHGWDRHLTAQQQNMLRTEYQVNEFYAKYAFYDLAYNVRPNEITGFLGLNQLRYLDEMVAKRERNFASFAPLYEREELVHPISVTMDVLSSFAIPVVFRKREDFETYRRRCEQKGIEIRPIVGGVMADQPFFKKYISQSFVLPNSRLIQENGFYFGNNPELTDDELKYLLDTFLE
jgi:CDP-6-deoxy-D-xylo-4-hexulose-3-dehydrase